MYIKKKHGAFLPKARPACTRGRGSSTLMWRCAVNNDEAPCSAPCVEPCSARCDRRSDRRSVSRKTCKHERQGEKRSGFK